MFRLAVLGLVAAASLGCASKPPPPLVLPARAPRPATDLIKTSYGAADALISQIAKTLPPPDTAFIVATLVNLNSLEESSALGRLVSEHLGARFAQNGYRVVETKLRNRLYIKRNTGELILSREVQEIAKKHNVSAIVSGTYADSADRIFVSLKIIEIEHNVVMAAFDYTLEKDRVTKSLLNPV